MTIVPYVGTTSGADANGTSSTAAPPAASPASDVGDAGRRWPEPTVRQPNSRRTPMRSHAPAARAGHGGARRRAQRLQGPPGILHAARQWPDAVQGRAERDHPGERDLAPRRLQAHQAARGRRDADRPARVRPDGDVAHAGGHRHGRSPARAARRMRAVAGMAHRPESRVLAGGPHRELVHVGAAEEHDAVPAQVATAGASVVATAVIEREPAVVTQPRWSSRSLSETGTP